MRAHTQSENNWVIFSILNFLFFKFMIFNVIFFSLSLSLAECALRFVCLHIFFYLQFNAEEDENYYMIFEIAIYHEKDGRKVIYTHGWKLSASVKVTFTSTLNHESQILQWKTLKNCYFLRFFLLTKKCVFEDDLPWTYSRFLPYMSKHVCHDFRVKIFILNLHSYLFKCSC